MSARDNLLLIAAREPVAGFTKTRLGRTIGMERAAALYRAFLADLTDRFTAATFGGRRDPDSFDLAWAYTPGHCDFAAVLAGLGRPHPASGDERVRLVRQEGQGWGDGQLNLLRWGYMAGYARTILIASDSPHVPVTIVERAFAALVDRDVAIGRVHDGGYYLIGLRGFHDVLSDVPMSTRGAADAVVARARSLDLRVAELPSTFDVDEAADLAILYEHLASEQGTAPATWNALHALGLIPVGSVVRERQRRSAPGMDRLVATARR